MSATKLSRTYNKLSEWYQRFWRPVPPKPPYTKHICKVGDPVLRSKADPVDLKKINSKEIQNVLDAMKKLIKKEKAAGLSAPQIGCSLQIIAVQYTKEMLSSFPLVVVQSRNMVVIPLKIFINPQMTVINNTKLNFPESCASIEGYSAVVPRFSEVKIKGFNENGENVEWTAKGWGARIIQHEMDHINGTLYTDIMNPRTFLYEYWYYSNIYPYRILPVKIKPIKFKHNT